MNANAPRSRWSRQPSVRHGGLPLYGVHGPSHSTPTAPPSRARGSQSRPQTIREIHPQAARTPQSPPLLRQRDARPPDLQPFPKPRHRLRMSRIRPDRLGHPEGVVDMAVENSARSERSNGVSAHEHSGRLFYGFGFVKASGKLYLRINVESGGGRDSREGNEEWIRGEELQRN
jgi:hypothetical protein